MTIKTKKRINNSEQPKVLCWTLFLMVFVCLFTYGYLVRGTIVDIVARQTMENQLSSLGSKVASLEAEYIVVKNEIDLEIAHTLGFVAVSAPKFVERDTDGVGLSLVIKDL